MNGFEDSTSDERLLEFARASAYLIRRRTRIIITLAVAFLVILISIGGAVIVVTRSEHYQTSKVLCRLEDSNRQQLMALDRIASKVSRNEQLIREVAAALGLPLPEPPPPIPPIDIPKEDPSC